MSEQDDTISIPMKIDELVKKIDPNYIGSDGIVNGKPAFQYDFTVGGRSCQVYFVG
jgi:hypothetical protein